MNFLLDIYLKVMIRPMTVCPLRYFCSKYRVNFVRNTVSSLFVNGIWDRKSYLGQKTVFGV